MGLRPRTDGIDARVALRLRRSVRCTTARNLPCLNLARADALQFEVVDFDQEDARQAAEIRAVLVRLESKPRNGI